MNFKKKSDKTRAERDKTAGVKKKETYNRFDEFFNGTWEVFVIKKDKATEKLVGKIACCATACV